MKKTTNSKKNPFWINPEQNSSWNIEDGILIDPMDPLPSNDSLSPEELLKKKELSLQAKKFTTKKIKR